MKVTSAIASLALLILSAAPAALGAYQYILTPGYDPAAASQAKTSASSSSSVAMETGAFSTPSASYALEARYRTWLEAILQSRLNSFKAGGFYIILR